MSRKIQVNIDLKEIKSEVLIEELLIRSEQGLEDWVSKLAFEYLKIRLSPLELSSSEKIKKIQDLARGLYEATHK